MLSRFIFTLSKYCRPYFGTGLSFFGFPLPPLYSVGYFYLIALVLNLRSLLETTVATKFTTLDHIVVTWSGQSFLVPTLIPYCTRAWISFFWIWIERKWTLHNKPLRSPYLPTRDTVVHLCESNDRKWAGQSVARQPGASFPAHSTVANQISRKVLTLSGELLR